MSALLGCDVRRVGFEPTVGLPLRLISSQVHSTTLPPLLCVEACDYSQISTAHPHYDSLRGGTGTTLTQVSHDFATCTFKDDALGTALSW